MAMQQSIIGTVSVNRGRFDNLPSGTVFYKENLVERYGSVFRCKVDQTTQAPATTDAQHNITVGSDWEYYVDNSAGYKEGERLTAVTAAMAEMEPRLDAVEREVEEIKTNLDTFEHADVKDVMYNSLEESNPVASGEYGSDDPSDLFGFVMVQHGDEENEDGTADYTPLERNNIFRLGHGMAENGTLEYVPSVSITDEEMAAANDTSHGRYVMVGNTVVKSFAVGAEYDALGVLEAIKEHYAEHPESVGESISMTSGDTAGLHVVMPWETTSQDMSIYIGNREKVWLIDHQQGKSGKVHTAIMRNHKVLDGIDPYEWELAPTGLTPSGAFTITKDGKTVTRCHFTTRKGMTNCIGGKGEGDACDALYNNGTYPRVSDCQQINLMNWARANNSDAEKPYPHAEGGYHALNTLICALEVEHKTKYLHNLTLFSSGISTNDGCSNESQLFTRTGFRYRAVDSEEWSYSSWNQDVNIYKQDGTKYKSYNVINNEYPKERSMEAQMAASWAAEMGIPGGEHFTTPYGGEYWFENASGAEGAISEKMAVRLYSLVKTAVNAYNAENEATTFEVEIVLRVGLYNGFNMSGDIYKYCGGGAEIVATVTEDSQLAQGAQNVPLSVYVQPDQRKWERETDVHKGIDSPFGFMMTYKHIADKANSTNSYARDRAGYTPLRTVDGGGLSTYMCCYGYHYNYFNNSALDRLTRTALRFFGYASSGDCSPRHVRANYAVSNTSRCYGGLAQVLLGRARHAQ